MPGVLVFGDVVHGELTPVSLEVAAAGRQIADALGEPALGALIGTDLQAASHAFCAVGFSRLLVADAPQFTPYRADPYVAAGEAIVRACGPSVALFPHDLKTREWVARLAFRLDTGLVTDCVGVR